MQSQESVDEMWLAIEQFGLKRSMIEDGLNTEQVRELYLSIKGKQARI